MDTFQTLHTEATPSGLSLQLQYEHLENKYQELKKLKQKLLEHVKKKEQDHREEVESYKKRLEENKISIRKLEDDNLHLRFETMNLKRSEVLLQEQLEEVKSLLCKYYYKAKHAEIPSRGQVSHESIGSGQSDPLQISNPDSNRLKLPIEKINTQREHRGGVPKIYVVPEYYDDSPTSSFQKQENFTFINAPSLKKEHKRSYTRSEMEVPADGTETFKGRSNSLRRESDLLDLKIVERTKSNFVDMEDIKSATIKQEGREERRRRIFKNSMPRYSSPESEGSPLKKSKKKGEFHFSHARPRSVSLSITANVEYLSRFNALSQNIVSLGVKPEIQMDQLALPNADSNQTNLYKSSPSPQKKTPRLKYVSKHTPEHTEHHNHNNHSAVKISGFSVEDDHENSRALFEDFLVIGVDKEDLLVYSQQHPEKKSGKLKPRVLSNHSEQFSLQHESAYKSIPDFVFPFGVQAYKLKSTPSFSALNPIIYISNDGDQRSKCFMFPLLSGDGSDTTSKMGEIIDASNSNHLLYIICITFKDFITMTGATSKSKRALKDIKYWEVNKVMCFMTYYPIASFLFDVLTKFLDILKVERVMQMSQITDNQNLARHETIDGSFTTKYITTILKKNLSDILTTKALKFSMLYDVKLHGNFMESKLSLEIPDSSKAFTMEGSWACITVFGNLSLKDIIWLFTALMLEKKLVFLSKNLYLLTATLAVLHSLMKPFKYPFPLIFNLPEVLMVICDAPGAALIGINKGEDYLKKTRLLEEYPSCIFICLDEDKIYMESQAQAELPSLDNFEKAILGHYIKLNPNMNRVLMEAKKASKRQQVPRVIKYVPNKEEKAQCVEILELFRNKLDEKIIKFVPTEPIYDGFKHFDVRQIGEKLIEKAVSMDKEFLKQFIKTQIFTYFIEQYYEAK